MNHEDTTPVRPADDRGQPAVQTPSTATTGAPGDSTAAPADDGTANAAPAAPAQASTTAAAGTTDTGSSANATPPADEARPAGSTAAAAGETTAEGESPAAAQTAAPARPADREAGTTAPAIVLPADIEALDNRLQAALLMVGRGINRLSRLAGNIRFAFLQRDESRLANERKALKEGFARQERSEAELKFGLQAVLQKAERLAGSLLYVPAAPASGQRASEQTDADTTSATPPADAGGATPGTGADAAPAAEADAAAASTATEAAPPSGTDDARGSAAAPSPAESEPARAPAAPALPVARSGQIRQSVRKAMMALAPAAPLHLQIELAADFAETDPDIMGMAARVHALHRQVLGSLKSILWHSPLRCTLGFEDGRTLVVEFGEQGLKDLPAAFRQNRSPEQRSSGAHSAAGERGRPGRDDANAARKDGQRGAGAGGRRNGGKDRRTGQPPGSDATGKPAGRAHEGRRPKRPGNAGDGQPGGQPGDQPGSERTAGAGRRSGQRSHEGGKTGPHAHGGQRAGGRREGEASRRPPRRDGAERHQGRDRGGNTTPARAGKGFPGNSAMADKLREALGGQLKLPGTNKEGAK